MPVSVRLPLRVEQKLAEYCTSNRVSKSEAIKRALEQLLSQQSRAPGHTPAALRFIGSDKRPGDVARHSKRLLREHFRGK